ncbi:MAG: hypothetical protein GY830_02950 [Bacteroidetes bacterium]|nr:hypothetical protein [Bacteroidota bacterium]
MDFFNCDDRLLQIYNCKHPLIIVMSRKNPKKLFNMRIKISKLNYASPPFYRALPCYQAILK